MRMHGVAVLAIVSLLAAVRPQAAEGDAKEKAVEKDLLALKGTWRLSFRQEDGKEDSKNWIKDVIATTDGSGKMSVRRGDKVLGEGSVKLDPTTKPKSVDVTFTEGRYKGKTCLGIYEIEGDTFRVCCARPGDERPAAFSSEAGSGRVLVVYQRQTK
jgi:uncharacterized protein (TIGR03067 family)